MSERMKTGLLIEQKLRKQRDTRVPKLSESIRRTK